MASSDGGAEDGERTKRGRHGSVTVDESDLRAVFHMPITEAATRLGVCVTVLKVRCRELGIARWPFRKMRKLDNMISFLEKKEAATRRGGKDGASKLETIKKTRELVLAQPNSDAHTRVGKINSQLRRQMLESSSLRSNSEDEGSGKSGSGSLEASGSGSNEQSQRSARTADVMFGNKKRSRGDWEQTSASTEATAHGGIESLIDAATAMVSKDESDRSSDEHASDDGSTLLTIDARLHHLISPLRAVSPFEAFQLHTSGAFAMRDVAPRGWSYVSNPGSAREFPQGVHRPTPRRFDPSSVFSAVAAPAHATDALTARRALIAANASR